MTATNRVIISVTSVLYLLTMYGCDSKTVEESQFTDKSELVVAMDIDMPGYFEIDGENFGYQYDLMQAYADDAELALRVIDKTTNGEGRRLLKGGEADIVVALSSNVESDQVSFPLYETSFVVLTKRADAGEFRKLAADNLTDALEEKRVLVSPAFTSTKSFRIMLEAQRGSSYTAVASSNCISMAEDLRNGMYDFVICEKSEAQIASALIDGVSQVYDFAEKSEISLVLNPLVNGLEENFTDWLNAYSNSDEYAVLNDIYFEAGIVGQMIFGKGSEKRLHRGISDYDNMMREVSEREGVDWRFLSAIAYHESRFQANAVSPVGARGLMQIMPIVARQFSVPQEDVMIPEVNIMLAAKLLGKLESMLKFSEDISYEDKMSIILACYNCGVGHVMDARNLAVKYGYDANSWDDVSLFLQRKALAEYSNDSVVRNGRFTTNGSNQTIAFVSNVMGKYNSYCAVVRR